MTGLWAKNCATIQQVLILKFSFGPEKFLGLLRNGHQASKRAGLEKLAFNFLLALKGWGWEGVGLVSGLNQNLWQHFAILILAAFCKSEQLTTCLQIECYCSTSTKQINTHLYSNISCSTMFNIVYIWLHDFHIFITSMFNMLNGLSQQSTCHVVTLDQEIRCWTAWVLEKVRQNKRNNIATTP